MQIWNKGAHLQKSNKIGSSCNLRKLTAEVDGGGINRGSLSPGAIGTGGLMRPSGYQL